jgi:hypothetical protein
MTYYDPADALLDRRAFALPTVFRDELFRIFGRSWLFVGPEAWVNEPGRFFTARAGVSPVIVWRGRSGALHLVEDICPLCLRNLASGERGEADFFVCPCSPRRYGEVDAADMLNAGRLEAYNGLLFAARGEAPPFLAAIGDFEPYLRRLTRLHIVGDTAVRWRATCNWKLAVEAGCGFAEAAERLDGFQAATEAGVAVFAEESPQSAEIDDLPRLTPLAGALFPNLTFEHHAGAMHVWCPIGRDLTEVHSFCIVPRDADAGEADRSRRAFILAFGAGDAARGRRLEAWSAITRAAANATFEPLWLNVQAGREGERRSNLPGVRGSLAGETNARAFYAWWQDRLGSKNGVAVSYPLPHATPIG